jgi:hypothetical protein
MRVSPVILALLLVARSNLINSSADQSVPEVEGRYLGGTGSLDGFRSIENCSGVFRPNVAIQDRV